MSDISVVVDNRAIATVALGVVQGGGGPGGNGEDGREVELRTNGTHIQWRYVGSASWIDLVALSTLKGVDGSVGPAGFDGRDVSLRVDSGNIQWQRVGDTGWTTLVALSSLQGPAGEDGAPGTPGEDGTDGREVQFRIDSGFIQWQYVGSGAAWTNLVAVADLQGPAGSDGATGAAGTPGVDGKQIEISADATHLRWRYVGDSSWVNLVALSTFVGPAGADGREVELRTSGGFVQWRRVGDATWNNLTSVASITGPQGTPGTDGASVELQKTATHVQWRLVGTTTWNNLIALSELKGATGDTGATGSAGVNGKEVILRSSGEFLQWAYSETTPTWNNLVPLSDLKGADGTGVSIKGSFSNTSQLPASGATGDAYLINGDLHVWTGSAWNNVGTIQGPIGATGAAGTPGTNGKNVELQKTATHVQWRLVGDTTWNNLIALVDLTGPVGADGTDGTDGLQVSLQTTATHIQWRLGTGAWTNLIALADLKGEPAEEAGYPVFMMPDGVDGQAVWYAVDNTPTLSDSNPPEEGTGKSYMITGSVYRDLGSGPLTCLTFDYVSWNGTNWEIIPQEEFKTRAASSEVASLTSQMMNYVSSLDFDGINTNIENAATEAKDRANHTGTQSADTVVDGTANKVYTAAEKTKLTGIATGATANSADATLLNRANHTGTQTSSTIADFNEAVQDAVAALLVGTSGVSLSYDDVNNSLTITGPGAVGLDAEAVRDAIGVAIVGAGNINVAVNDVADTITITTNATVNDTDANLRARSSHTGTQSADTLTDGATNRLFSTAEKNKLSGIAAGATVNSTDAALRDRSTHTGSQASSTISDFTAEARNATGAVFVKYDPVGGWPPRPATSNMVFFVGSYHQSVPAPADKQVGDGYMGIEPI